MFTLDQVVPWGRSFDEYRRMFGLTDDDLGRTIIGCGDGPANFNGEATRRGARVVSSDPIYRLETAQIRVRIAATYDQILEQTRQNAEEFVWDSIQSVDAAFDLALCSHFLFLYTSQLGEAFHRSAIREMCRVASEVRIFPLLALGGCRSPYVDNAVGEFRDSGFDVSIENVPYEFQRGGNQMMRLRKLGTADG